MDRYRVPESRWLCFPLRLQLIISPILRSPQQTLVNTRDFPDIPLVTPVTLSRSHLQTLRLFSIHDFSSRFLPALPVPLPRPGIASRRPPSTVAAAHEYSFNYRELPDPFRGPPIHAPAPLLPPGILSGAAVPIWSPLARRILARALTLIVIVVDESLCRRSTTRVT